MLKTGHVVELEHVITVLAATVQEIRVNEEKRGNLEQEAGLHTFLYPPPPSPSRGEDFKTNWEAFQKERKEEKKKREKGRKRGNKEGSKEKGLKIEVWWTKKGYG